MKTNAFIDQILTYLALSKQKPYLSYWGELFALLYQIRKEGRAANQDILLYDLPTGRLKYSYEKDRFAAELPEMNILLKADELIDSWIRGILVPSPPSGAEHERT